MNNEISNSFLNDHSFAKNEMSIFLKNGVKLVGLILDFDDECIIIDCTVYGKRGTQLIMRAAISTVQINPA